MLSKRQLEALLKVFSARMQRVNDQYLQLMGEHLKMIGELTPSDVHRLTQLKQMRGNIRQIKRSIAKAAGASEADIEKVFEAAAESNERFMRAYYAEAAQEPIKGQMGRSEPLERILKAQLRITEQEMRNLSRTTVVDSAYKNVVDIAVQAVQSGLADYKSAIRSAMAAAGKSGLRVQYASGATRRLDSAMRQNVLDGVRTLNNDVLRQLGKEYGADGIEISAHALCAEDHLPYQGRQFTTKQFNDIQAQLDRPFGMWNCKHTIFPIILGVSVQALDDETLKKYHRLSAEQVTIDDKTLSRYEWSQEQRRIETAVRAQKDVATLAEASGDMKAVRAAQANIYKLMDYYDKISEESGIRQEYGRMAVQRINNSSSTSKKDAASEVAVESGYKKLTGRDFDDNIDVDVPKDVRKCIDKASKRVTADFPILDDYLYAVGYGKNEPNNPATAVLSIRDGYVGQVISLNRDMWTSAKAMDAFVQGQSAQGGHIQARHADSIITHEYGHVLHNSCALKWAGYAGQGMISQQQIMRFALEKKKIVDEVQLLVRNAGLTLESERASDNGEEFIAEAVSDYYSGKRIKASKIVIDYLKRRFE